MTETNHFAEQVIADLLHARTGQSLNSNRRWRIGAALASLSRTHGFSSVEQLAVELARPGRTGLEQSVAEALLNNETYFFRDRAMFDHLERKVLPAIAHENARTRRIAIWSAGCSTGQEALSLAMIFAANLKAWEGWHIDILGTDVSGPVIDAARMGRYAHFEVQRGLGVMEMLTHFEQSEQGWQVKGDLLRRVRFEKHNLLDGAPGNGKFDLVLCRNVLLYFEGETRKRAVSALEKSLAGRGYLMVGAGESLLGMACGLRPTAEVTGLYNRAPETPERASSSLSSTPQ